MILYDSALLAHESVNIAFIIYVRIKNTLATELAFRGLVATIISDTYSISATLDSG